MVAEKCSSELKEIRTKYRGAWESDVDGAFGKWYALVCDKQTMENKPKRYALEEPLRIKYADKFWEIEQGYLNSLFKQKYFANNLSRVSPISLYENVMSALAGTDLSNSQYFMNRIRVHRNKVIEYIRSKTDNFSSLSYCTTSKEGEWEEYKKIGQKWREKKIAETPSLDLQDFPKFTYKLEFINNLQRAIPDIGFLLFFNVCFFMLSFVAFVRYDVRSD